MSKPAPKVTVTVRSGGLLSAGELYELLKVRSEVLIVEHKTPYQDLDDRDLDERALHVLARKADVAVGALRIAPRVEGDYRLGRLSVVHEARGRGVARAMLEAALVTIKPGTRLVTHARVHLVPWYESFCFSSTGPVFHEVGIPHVPMELVKPGD